MRAAIASQTCQCEKSPSEIKNSLVTLKSAVSRQKPSTNSTTADGVRRDAVASATCLFFRCLCETRGPERSRIRTTIPVEFSLPVMKKLRTAIIGTGFMGKVHAENVRRHGNVEIAAVAGSSDEKARQFGQSIGVDKT